MRGSIGQLLEVGTALVACEEGDHAHDGESQEEGGGHAEEGAPEAPVDAAAGAEITLDGLVAEGLGAVLDDGQGRPLGTRRGPRLRIGREAVRKLLRGGRDVVKTAALLGSMSGGRVCGVSGLVGSWVGEAWLTFSLPHGAGGDGGSGRAVRAMPTHGMRLHEWGTRLWLGGGEVHCGAWATRPERVTRHMAFSDAGCL